MSQAPGWYTDPFIRDQERYWDGRVWTQGFRPAGATEAALVQPGAAPAVPAPDVLGGDASPDEGPSFAPLGAPAPPVVVAPLAPPAASAVGWTPPLTGSENGRRNHRRLAVLGIGAAALVLVGAGVAAALVLGGPSNASASEAVATAATQTINAQSADMSMSMDVSILGTQESITANGAFDFAHHTGTMTMDLPIGGKQLTEQAIYDGSTVYVNVAGLLGELAPQGKQWVSADIGQLDSGAGGLGGMDAFGDPAAMLQQLQSIGGTVTSLGPTTYDGTSVTEYSVDIPPSALEGEIGQLPSSLKQGLSGVSLPDIKSDVYITNDNLLKAMHMPMSFSVAGQSISMDMTMSFSNYGTPVTVTPPPASEVTPLSSLGGGLGGNTGATGNTGNSDTFGNSGNSGGLF